VLAALRKDGVEAREVADAIPGCRYVEIPACGHAGPFENPDVVNHHVIEFFAEH
jgi:pimeloyl-ACP methyl ester carboxylesterase